VAVVVLALQLMVMPEAVAVLEDIKTPTQTF
jgi:hypothetical protein